MSNENQYYNALQGVADLIRFIGEDPDREGLKETPARVVNAYREMFSGYSQDPIELIKTFSADGYDELVLVKDIDFTSCCEHHLMPFMGTAHIAYIPDKKVIGLSKLPRLLGMYAKRLQIQERLTCQVTKALDDGLSPKGSACIIRAKHMCLSCRGAKKINASMVTSSLTGAFREPACRQELMQLVFSK